MILNVNDVYFSNTHKSKLFPGINLDEYLSFKTHNQYQKLTLKNISFLKFKICTK